MTDPAVEAAKKAWNGAGVYRTIAENAAREALKPIRDVRSFYPVCNEHLVKNQGMQP